MKILILGGTAWLGRTVAAAAHGAGHHVTCVARGDGVPPGVRIVPVDRDEDAALASVAAERWDAVIDVARQPVQVRRAVRDLRDVADRYIFVSTGNVYATQEDVGADEDAALFPPFDGDGMATMDDYGPAKVACENAVLVQDTPDLPTASIDVRDLAEWLVLTAVQRRHGTFNAVGRPVLFPEYVRIARSVAQHSGGVVTAPEKWLLEQGVGQWSGEWSLPLWLADPTWYGMNSRSNARAVAAGLCLRPLRDTLADTLARDTLPLVDGPLAAGLTDTEELALLQALVEEGLTLGKVEA